jgi:hypothetical protein
MRGPVRFLFGRVLSLARKGTMSILKKSLTFSNAIALLALFIALGGTVYAASGQISGAQIKPKSLPANRLKAKSITGNQIKNGAIGQAQLKPGSISAKQIKAGSITGSQIKAGSISGTQVQANSLGATQINQSTLTGISAANIHTVQYVTTTVPLPPETENGTTAVATCPAGMKVIGGGASTSNPKAGFSEQSSPNAEHTGWSALGFAFEPGVTLTVTAICTFVAAPVG